MTIHRSNRSSTTNLTTPHITLEIPTANYGQFLSPIHEVPTPLPSPAHTPIPSVRRVDRGSSSSDSSSLLLGNSARLDRKRSQLRQQAGNCNSSDESCKSGSSAPSIIIDSVASSSSQENQERQSISIVVPSAIQIRIESDSTQPSPVSSASNSPMPSPAKTKPPPLNILNSNFTRFEAFETSTESNEFQPAPPARVPLLCVSEPSPDTDLETVDRRCLLNQSGKKSQRKSILDWEHVSLGSPPLRKVPVDVVVNSAAAVHSINDASMRRAFKDTLDKSSSLDLPHPPPMITITANFSEVESDSDTGMLGKYSLVRGFHLL